MLSKLEVLPSVDAKDLGYNTLLEYHGCKKLMKGPDGDFAYLSNLAECACLPNLAGQDYLRTCHCCSVKTLLECRDYDGPLNSALDLAREQNKIKTVSPFPFGVGHGHGTRSELICGLCGTIHNKGIDVDNGDAEGRNVLSVYYGDIEVADCCFKKLEEIVFSSAEQIIDWLGAIVDDQEAKSKALRELIKR